MTTEHLNGHCKPEYPNFSTNGDVAEVNINIFSFFGEKLNNQNMQ